MCASSAALTAATSGRRVEVGNKRRRSARHAFEVAAAHAVCRPPAHRHRVPARGRTPMIRLLIVAEVRFYREGLVELFAREEMEIVGAVASADEALARAVELAP